MMDDILISIVIPLYNKEEYIGRCLDSIFCQNNEHIEIIVVDDGSTDKGCNIVENYKYNNLRLIRKKMEVYLLQEIEVSKRLKEIGSYLWMQMIIF